VRILIDTSGLPKRLRQGGAIRDGSTPFRSERGSSVTNLPLRIVTRSTTGERSADSLAHLTSSCPLGHILARPSSAWKWPGTRGRVHGTPLCLAPKSCPGGRAVANPARRPHRMPHR
jgi:hypothetical protein